MTRSATLDRLIEAAVAEMAGLTPNGPTDTYWLAHDLAADAALDLGEDELAGLLEDARVQGRVLAAVGDAELPLDAVRGTVYLLVMEALGVGHQGREAFQS